MARATFRQRPPTRGIGRPLLTAAAARSFYNNPNRWGSMSPPSQPIPLPAKPGRLVPLRFLETTDSLRIVAGAARRPALFPQLFPIPDPGRHLGRQRESELMREHTHLPAMVGFVRKHVAQHFDANRPRPSPAVSQKLLDAAFVLTTVLTIAERFSEHLRAASRALGQSRAGLPWRAVRAVELSWNFQMRSCKPHPFAAD